MIEDSTVTERMDSWKEIAAYIKRSVRTAIRWEKQKGFPVHRIPGGERQNVFAYRREIDRWMQNGSFISAPSIDPAEPLAGALIQCPSEPLAEDLPVSATRLPASDPATSGRSYRRVIWLGCAAAVVALACLTVRSASPKRFVLDQEEQITNDGTLKSRLVTDGTNVYFGEWRDGRIALFAVSVNGGAQREIPTPFIQTEPVAVSPDGDEVLALVGEGQELERPLWTIPLHGGTPWRTGSLVCHAAAWSTDRREIACANGNAIYLSEDDGATRRLLHSFPGVPDDLHWSLDNARLLFRVHDDSTWKSALWQLSLSPDGNPAIASLVPLNVSSVDWSALSPAVDARDDAFAATAGPESTIFSVAPPRSPWQKTFSASEFTRRRTFTIGCTVDTRAHRLYVLESLGGTSELDRFDTKTQQFRPFLPGVPAYDVDFSRDGKTIVYVSGKDRTLWLATSDGGSARKLEMPNFIDIELPRWSPDGKRIAFMGKQANGPYRILVVPAAGGTPREASQGNDNQGAPTWSPDGRRLVYGRVMCQEERNCSIQEINLETGTQAMVPDSEGLSTARWSPDGRFIAALREDRHQVFVLDRRTAEWRKIAEGVNGNDLAWSKDSRTIYASRPDGDRPEVLRISLNNGKSVAAVDLSAFSKLSGRVDTWFALTPNDSILFLRFVTRDEVYAMHYSEN